jgi:hypothetical protein
MFRSWSNLKSSREKVPSSRFDLSMTGMCGAIFFSFTLDLEIPPDARSRLLSLANSASHQACRSALNMTFRYSEVFFRPRCSSSTHVQ